MKKPLLFSAITLIAATGARAEGPASVGFAESKNPFVIARAEAKFNGAAGQEMMVRRGDMIASGQEKVRVQTTAGDTLFIDAKSRAGFTPEGLVTLQAGRVLAIQAKDSKLAVEVDGLRVVALAEPGQPLASGGMIAVERSAEDRVSVASVNQRLTVALASTGETLGLVSGSAPMKLTKSASGWTVDGVAGKVIAQNDTTETTDATADKEGDEEPMEEKKKRRAFLWIFPATPVGIGAAAVAGTAVVVGGVAGGAAAYDSVSNNNEDSGGGDNGREPSSRVAPK